MGAPRYAGVARSRVVWALPLGWGCAGGLGLLRLPPKPASGFALAFWGYPHAARSSPRLKLPGRRLRSRASPSAPSLSLSVAGFAGPVARSANFGGGPNSPAFVPRLPLVAPSLRSGYGECGCRASPSVFIGYARSPLVRPRLLRRRCVWGHGWGLLALSGRKGHGPLSGTPRASPAGIPRPSVLAAALPLRLREGRGRWARGLGFATAPFCALVAATPLSPSPLPLAHNSSGSRPVPFLRPFVLCAAPAVPPAARVLAFGSPPAPFRGSCYAPRVSPGSRVSNGNRWHSDGSPVAPVSFRQTLSSSPPHADTERRKKHHHRKKIVKAEKEHRCGGSRASPDPHTPRATSFHYACWRIADFTRFRRKKKQAFENAHLLFHVLHQVVLTGVGVLV